MTKSVLICPVCREALQLSDKAAVCPNGHSFDRAKEGYVNLLRTSRRGDRMGDDKLSARSRRDFLNKGYYALLRHALQDLFAQQSGTVLDICCGEGYYTAALGDNPLLHVYGFDLSKEMVRLAAKRGGATYFVANMAAIPVADGSMDAAVHLFAPFHEAEFFRVLREGGRLYTVVPGARHLYGLKTLLYERPYVNDEQLPRTEGLRLCRTEKIRGCITLDTNEDIRAVFRMTPYFYHTSREDSAKLNEADRLETEIEFLIAEYRK